MPEPETLLRRDTVFDGRLIQLHVDHVRLAGGQETERHIVTHPGSVVVVALDGEALLLVRQYRHAVGRALVELPAGALAPGEDPEAAAHRELVEETGYAAARWQHLGTLLVSPGFMSETMAFFLAEDLRPASAPGDEDEDLETLRLPWPEAVSRARRADFDDIKTVAGILLAAATRGGQEGT